MTRRRLIFFVAALIGAPVVAAVSLGLHGFDADRPVLRVVLPGALGLTAGLLLLVALSALGGRRLRVDQEKAGDVGTLGFALIACGALVGTSSSHLPTWLDAMLLGWTIGFLLGFDVLMARLWRRDPAFRERITVAVRKSS